MKFYYLSTSLFYAKFSEYTRTITGTMARAYVHPGSTFSQAEQSRLPAILCFEKILKTSQTFLVQACAVTLGPNQIQDAVPLAMQPLYRSRIAPIHIDQQRVPAEGCWSSALVRAAFVSQSSGNCMCCSYYYPLLSCYATPTFAATVQANLLLLPYL